MLTSSLATRPQLGRQPRVTPVSVDQPHFVHQPHVQVDRAVFQAGAGVGVASAPHAQGQSFLTAELDG